MYYIIAIIGSLLSFFVVGRIIFSVQFRKQVKTLFYRSKNISNQRFHKSQLNDLPEPVQRYFGYVLKEEQPYISYFRMTHDGQFKTGIDKGWIDIKGEQYATIEKPGLIWKGKTSLFTARDIYLEGKGMLNVWLFSFLRIIDGKGFQYDQGELLRWLGESVLYPTNLLPSKRLKWFAIDALSAKLTFDYNGLSLFYKVKFNVIGEIVELETKRYMDKKNLETWIVKLSNYKEFSDITVPTSFEVLWRLRKGDLCYARFNVTKLDYNIPKMF